MPPINPIAEATSDELSLASPESVIFNVRTSTGVCVADNCSSKSGTCDSAMTFALFMSSIFLRNWAAISFFNSIGT
jgi:hypothetical protein